MRNKEGWGAAAWASPWQINSHSFIMPMSMQRLRRQAWQWRRLSLVMVQLPLNGQVKEALRFMLRLRGWGRGGREGGERSREGRGNVS